MWIWHLRSVFQVFSIYISCHGSKPVFTMLRLSTSPCIRPLYQNMVNNPPFSPNLQVLHKSCRLYWRFLRRESFPQTAEASKIHSKHTSLSSENKTKQNNFSLEQAYLLSIFPMTTLSSGFLPHIPLNIPSPKSNPAGWLRSITGKK